MVRARRRDRKSTRLNSSHGSISYAVFCLKKKNKPVALAFAIEDPNAAVAQSSNSSYCSAFTDIYQLYVGQIEGTHRVRIFFFNDTATTEIYTLSLHDALPI